MTEDKWEHADKWTLRGDHFVVEVTRHAKLNGDNAWCVYVYMHASHRLFDSVNVGHDRYYDIDTVTAMPLHGGCSYFFKLSDNCIKIGCDYSHLHDDRYALYKTKDEAYSVFVDAKELFDWMTNVNAIPKA